MLVGVEGLDELVGEVFEAEAAAGCANLWRRLRR